MASHSLLWFSQPEVLEASRPWNPGLGSLVWGWGPLVPLGGPLVPLGGTPAAERPSQFLTVARGCGTGPTRVCARPGSLQAASGCRSCRTSVQLTWGDPQRWPSCGRAGISVRSGEGRAQRSPAPPSWPESLQILCSVGPVPWPPHWCCLLL